MIKTHLSSIHCDFERDQCRALQASAKVKFNHTFILACGFPSLLTENPSQLFPRGLQQRSSENPPSLSRASENKKGIPLSSHHAIKLVWRNKREPNLCKTLPGKECSPETRQREPCVVSAHQKVWSLAPQTTETQQDLYAPGRQLLPHCLNTRGNMSLLLLWTSKAIKTCIQSTLTFKKEVINTLYEVRTH